jgi:hypothetical protein
MGLSANARELASIAKAAFASIRVISRRSQGVRRLDEFPPEPELLRQVDVVPRGARASQCSREGHGFCMSEAGVSVRGDLRKNRKPQPAKTVLPNKHSMNALIVFLAALNVLIWGHNVVMIAGIIASMLVNAFSS